MSDNRLDAIKRAAAKELEWRSLECFEPERKRIAESVSEKLKIPIEEFEDTVDTAPFHFVTLCLAIGNWLVRSREEELDKHEYAPMSEFEYIAREKAVAGVLVRLFSHPFVQHPSDVPQFDAFLISMAQASGSKLHPAAFVISAHTYVRNASLDMADFLAGGGGDEDGPPVTMDLFDPYFANLDDKDGDEIMPRDAAVDAAIQLCDTLAQINRRDDLPVSLENLPEDQSQAQQFLRSYLLFAGADRKPALFRRGELTFENATLGAAIASLSSKRPWVLIDTLFEPGGEALELSVPLNPLAENQAIMKFAQLLHGELSKVSGSPKAAISTLPIAS